jgi:hypothetical protein
MKLKPYPFADKPLRKAVELSSDNETANDTLAENLFQISKSVIVNGKTGEEIDVLRKWSILIPNISPHTSVSVMLRAKGYRESKRSPIASSPRDFYQKNAKRIAPVACSP